MSPTIADAAGRPGRRPVDERLMATGTVLDSIVAARRERIGELRERFGHLRAAEEGEIDAAISPVRQEIGAG